MPSTHGELRHVMLRDRVRDIAAVIGRRLGVPVESVPSQTYGPLGPI